MKRVGHQEIHGETIAQFEFSQKGWNPFRHYRDEDQVDLLLRRRDRSKAPEYREIQVKWCRTWDRNELSLWERSLFTHRTWRNFQANEFINHRPELFVALVIPRPDGIYSGDFFLFTSSEFNSLIECAPLHKKNGFIKTFILGCSEDQNWFLCLQRTKFTNLMENHVKNITNSRRNFSILD